MIYYIKEALSYLPSSIKDNLLYQELEKKVLDVIADSVGELKVSADLFQEDFNDVPNITLCPSSLKEIIFFYETIINGVRIVFSISQADCLIINYISEEKGDIQNDSSIELDISLDEYRFFYKSIIRKDSCIDDVCIKTRYFNKDYHLIKEKEALESDLSIFANLLHLDRDKADFYMNNFSCYKQFLNDSYEIGIMEAINEIYPIYSFKPPFSYANIGVFFKTEALFDDERYQDEDLLLHGYYQERNNDFKMSEIDEQIEYFLDDDKWNCFLIFFVQQLGMNGEFAMSNALFRNLVYYFHYPHVQVLRARGLIIRKIDGDYTVFYVDLNEKEMIAQKEEISLDKARELYYQDGCNIDVTGLDTFFGFYNRR